MTYQTKKVKFKERFENAYQTFFDDTSMHEKNSLEYVSSETISATGENSFFSENTRKFFNILRQVFLFLPAAPLLLLVSVATTGFFILPPLGVARPLYFIELMIFLGLALITFLGLGDLRNPKHLSIPLSIISLGVILGFIGSLLFDRPGFGYFLFNYVPYFFPLALIAPILAKNWVDRIETNEKN